MSERPKEGQRLVSVEWLNDVCAILSKVAGDPQEQGTELGIAAECAGSFLPSIFGGSEEIPHYGYLYFSPESGIEWAPNHPVESGEVSDAEDVRPATMMALHTELLASWEALSEERNLRRKASGIPEKLELED